MWVSVYLDKKSLMQLLFPLFRSAISQKFPVYCQNHTKKTVSCVCPHLPPALQGSGSTERGGPSQHLLQALYLLCPGVQPHWAPRAGTATGTHR